MYSLQNNTNSSRNAEHTPAKILKSGNENTENIRDLNEILVVNKTPTIANPATDNRNKNSATILNNNEVMFTIPANQTAPIACEEEDADEEVEETLEEQSINNDDNEAKAQDVGEEYKTEHQQQVMGETAECRGGGKRSSRVRNYLKKCKDRWLAVGLHNQMPEYNNTGHDPKSTIDVSQDLRPATATKVTDIVSNQSPYYAISGIEFVNGGSTINCALGNVNETRAENGPDDNNDEDDDVVDASYKDIDFGLDSVLSKNAVTAHKQTSNPDTLALSYSSQAESRAAEREQSSLTPHQNHQKEKKYGNRLQLLSQSNLMVSKTYTFTLNAENILYSHYRVFSPVLLSYNPSINIECIFMRDTIHYYVKFVFIFCLIYFTFRILILVI